MRVLSLLLAGLSLLVPVVPTPRATAQNVLFSPSVEVRGLVSAPRTYMLADLQALPAEEVVFEVSESGEVQEHNFRGVSLHSLLMATGLPPGPPRAGDPLRFYAVIGGTDGYQVVVAWGEIAPGFEDKHVLVAYERDGQLLDEQEGMARLIVPGDRRGGRSVRNVQSSTLRRGDG